MKQRIVAILCAVTLCSLTAIGAAAAAGGMIAGSATGTGQQERVTLVTSGWVDVKALLGQVAMDAGLGLQLAPDVSGQVNVHLEDVPLPTALNSILDPIDLGYEIVDGVLVVYRNGMVTRWFNFDYPVTEREGRGELLVSAQSGGQSSSGGGGSGGGGEQNESHVTSSATMKVWPQVIGALQTLIFAGTDLLEESGQEGETQLVNLADSDGRTLVINPMAGLVQVTAEWDRVRKIGNLLERLEESLRRQVAIEVKILEVSLSRSHSTGIDWTTATGEEWDVDFQSTEGLTNPVFSFIVDSTHLDGLMEMVASHGSIRVLSAPRITTLNNQKAVVRIVTEEVFYAAIVQPPVVTNGVITPAVVEYFPQIYPVGIVLDVTPQVGQDRVVTLNVHPTISNIVRIESSPNNDTQPVLSVRELDTVGTVRDGETLVIAGLMSEGFRETVAGIPLLKEIPLLRLLFSRTSQEKTQTELVMLLTPVILDAGRAASMAIEAEQSIQKKM